MTGVIVIQGRFEIRIFFPTVNYLVPLKTLPADQGPGILRLAFKKIARKLSESSY